YVPVMIGMRELLDGEPGGDRHYAHAVLPVNFKPGTAPQEVKVTLRRGVKVAGKLVGPEGQQVPEAQMLTRLSTSAPMSIHEIRGVRVRGGSFELCGCDPEQAYPVIFLDEKNGWGARVGVSGKQAGQPLTVRLAECGSAVARFVDREGKPLANYWPQV